MNEESRSIIGYEGLYEITRSGRVYSLRAKCTMKRCGDEYGFHIVKLSKNGKGNNHNLFKLWEQVFEECDKEEFKGARKVKYK
jgi:hypothetical protein